MPKFRVIQYEVHSQAYVVEAENKGDAIAQVVANEVEAVGEPEFVEIDDTRGMNPDSLTAEEFDEVEDLIEDGAIIPTIASAAEIK